MHLKTIIAVVLLALAAGGTPRTRSASSGSRPGAPLTLSTVAAPAEVARGGAIAFTTTIADESSTPVAEVTLCDLIPSAAAAVIHAGGTHLFDNRACRTLPEVPAETSVSVRIVVRIGRRARLGVTRSTATALWAGTRLTAHATFQIGLARPLCPFG